MLERLNENDPEVAFAMAAETERHNREMQKWNAHFEHLQAIQKTIAKVFGG